jgi:multidrug resistance efflux pump
MKTIRVFVKVNLNDVPMRQHDYMVNDGDELTLNIDAPDYKTNARTLEELRALEEDNTLLRAQRDAYQSETGALQRGNRELIAQRTKHLDMLRRARLVLRGTVLEKEICAALGHPPLETCPACGSSKP